MNKTTNKSVQDIKPTKKQTKVEDSSESEEEVISKKPDTKKSESKKTESQKPESKKTESHKPETKQPETKKTKTKVKDVTHKKDSDDDDDDDDSDSESEADQEEQKLVEEDSDENDSASDDDESEEKPVKEKKNKESFESIHKKQEENIAMKKALHKKMVEHETEGKKMQREMNELEREGSKLHKLSLTAYQDGVNRARKERPKRTGNPNGGFNAPKPVPEVLRNYLGLPDDTMLALPQLMSRMNNKLSSTGQKDGQTANLTEKTLKALGLPHSEPRSIKFTEMMKFLSTFYPPKKETVEVTV